MKKIYMQMIEYLLVENKNGQLQGKVVNPF